MGYRDSIPEKIESKMRSWGLSAPLFRVLLETLRNELRTRSVEEYARQIVAPMRFLVLPLSVIDPTTDEMMDFVFWVNNTEDPDVRIVVDCFNCSQPPTGEPTGRKLGE
ncbi:MAG: hypothetical protein L6306_03150 [Planctomycetales bacterium]|nr:hypothetical protein [Planctomycetales bacterium]